MTENFGLLMGGLLSVFGFGWVIGKGVKTFRQFLQSTF